MKSYLKTIVSTILVYLMILSMLPMSVLSAGATEITLAGNGTEDSPYLITTADEFAYAMSTYGSDTEAYLSLENDIDISGLYQPVADFKAHFNGNYHTVTAITSFASKNTGIVSALTYRNNRIFDTPDSETYYRFNGFVYTNAGLLSGIFVHADITGSSGAIICNENTGSILNSAAFGSVETYDNDGADAAGIAVNCSGTISNCYVAATIKATGSSRYGVSRSHPITFGLYENSYFDSTICTLDYSDGYSREFMKSADFISLLNKDVKATDSLWTLDSEGINDGYPVLKSAYNAKIKCSKNNSLINGTEMIELYNDDGAEIYFTVDGSEPDLHSTLYTGPIEIRDTVTIKAKGYKNGLSGNSVQFAFAKVEGNGTNESPYIIDCEAALLSIPELSISAYYELSADIELTKEFNTLGNFYGSLDGKNHTISSVWSKKYQYGLFRNNYGIIQNVNLSSLNKNFNSNSALVYQNYGVISNCSYTGRITGYVPSGSSSENATYRSSNGSDLYGLGGFVSFNYGTINNSRFVGNLDVKEGNTIGGFVGVNDATITNCLFEGDVYVDDLHFFGSSVYSNKIGGFVGFDSANGTIDRSAAITDSIYVRTYSYAGGTAYTFGFLQGTQTECSCQNRSIVFYANYLEWGGRDTVNQSFDGIGYNEPEHIHNYLVEKVDPTCTEEGSASYACEDCGDTIDELVIPALGHDYGEEIIVDPTYEAEGYTHKICSRCGYDYKYNYVEAYKVETGSCGNDANYTMDTGKGTLVISGTGAINNYSSGYNSIKKVYRTTAPWGSYDIKSVVIEDGITSIGNYTFYRNEELEDVSLPSTLQNIGTSAFYGTALSSVELPYGLTTISNSSFGGLNNLTEIEIPNSVTSIGTTAFTDCKSLERVTLPCSTVLASSTDNYKNVFYNCNRLKTLYFTKGSGSMPDYDVSPFKSLSDQLVEVSFAEGVEYIGQNAFNGCSNLETVNMPLTQPVIGKDAFKGTAYYRTSFDENGLLISGTTLLDGMFAEGAVVIPDGVTEISDEAFKNNKKLTSITIPESVTTVGASVFYGCSGLTSLTVPCDLDLYKDDNSFSGVTNLTTLHMTKGSGEMLNFSGKYLYTPWYKSAAKFTTLTLDEGITSIGSSAFRELTKLENVTLPDTTTKIQSYSFYGDTAIKKIVIPENTESITTSFVNCSGIKELSIPVSVTLSSSLNSWSGCTGIEKVIFTAGTGTAPSFYGNYKCVPWYISRDSLKEVIIEDGVTNIGSYMFYQSKLTKISLPSSVKSIGSNAFVGCSDLSEVTLVEGLENIYSYAFSNCTGLTDIVFPLSLKSIGEYAFNNCSSLKSISIGEGVTAIGNSSFRDCTSLESLSISEGVSEIGSSAFRNCTSLVSVTIPESVVTLKSGAFYGCAGLKEVTIPSEWANPTVALFTNCTGIEKVFVTKGKGVLGQSNGSNYQYSPWYISNESIKNVILAEGITEIGSYSFYYCTGLKNIIIPSTVEKIGTYAFSNSGITELVLGENVQSIDYRAFYNASSLNELFILNNNCEISDSNVTISNNVTIVAYGDSTAKDYATKYSRAFKEIYAICPECSSWIFNRVITQPTCTEKGYSTYTCDACGHTYVSDEVDATGHDWSEGTITFSENGKTATATRICKHDASHSETVECTISSQVTKPSTCTASRDTTYTAVAVFSDGKSITDTKIITDIGAIGHAWTEGTITFSTDGKKATATRVCVNDSSHKETVNCTVTGKVTKAATCTEKGQTTYTAVGVFSTGEQVIDEKVVTDINALGHDWDEGIITFSLDGSSATAFRVCKTDHNHTETVNCTVTNKVIIPATCTEDGTTSYTATATFSDGAVITKTIQLIDIKASGHDWDGGTVTKAPTCTEKGELTFTCKNDPSHSYSVDIPTIAHNYSSSITKPTCTEKGYTTHTCLMCGDSYVDTYTDALGHKYESVVTPPTCTKGGYTIYTCSVCGESYDDDFVVETGHEWDNGTVTKAPTCTAEGIKTYTCKHDSSHTYTEPINSLGHEWDEGEITKKPSCTEQGEKTYKCKHDPSHTYTEPIEASGHRYESVVTPPSCTAGGYTTYTCSVCSDSYTDDYTEMIAHSYQSVVTPPNCTQGGYTTYTCSSCHDSYVADYTEALGHKWNNGVITTEPDCIHTGVKTFTCTVCSETKEETVDALGHQWDDGIITKEPTYHETGEKLFTCTVCKATSTEEIPCLEKIGKFVVSNETVRAGDEVKVKIYIDKNPGITALSINVNFPAELSLIDIKYTNLLSSKPSNSQDYSSPLIISWLSPGSLDEDGTGLFATLTFVVDINAEATDYTVRVTYKADNIIDSTLDEIPFETENGTVSVQRPTPGDVNRDGVINMKDIVLIQQYINHWDVQIVERAADVNDDGDINMKDLVILQQYINGWEVELK